MVVALAAVIGLVGGLVVPACLRRLPEPDEAAPDKPLHADLAVRPSLLWSCGFAGGATGALLGWCVPAPWPLALWLALLPLGLLLAVVDWHTRLLPGVLVRPALGLTLAAVVVVELARGEHAVLLRALVAMVASYAFFWLLWRLHAAGLGYGDVRLSALLGLLLGHLGVGEAVLGTYASFVLFGVPALVVAVVRRDRGVLRRRYPFGPAMLAGAVVGACWGGALWAGLAGG